ncbi:MAG: hypothetical protein A2Y07_06915 [Planctomycetes bacterium GWF2_50_10]|nr:MAG: hypothetical protein A2Y07_06915 [Planctomycetes bacterium GWF2_50_10]
MQTNQKFRHLDLFSGIGGFALAASSVWGDAHEVAAFCEIDKFCQRILKKHWPQAAIIEDIRKFDAKEFAGTIDILTGGFPCQPFSTAGKRRGKEDDRYLWPAMLRIISEVRPRWIIGENVAGFVSMVESVGPAVLEGSAVTRSSEGDVYEAVYSRQEYMLIEHVCRDLEKEGYSVQPFIIPACGVDAPHKRDRVWIVANSQGERISGGSQEICKAHGRPQREMRGQPFGTGENAPANCENDKPQQQEFDSQDGRCPSASRLSTGTGAVCRTDGRHTSEGNKEFRRDPIVLPPSMADTQSQSENGECREPLPEPDQRHAWMESQCRCNGCNGPEAQSPLADSQGLGCDTCIAESKEQRRNFGTCGQSHDVADTSCQRLEGIGSGGQQESGVHGEEVISMCSGSDLCQWPAEPRVGRVAHGIPNRVDRLKGLGNAIVPQVALMIMNAINEIESGKE